MMRDTKKEPAPGVVPLFNPRTLADALGGMSERRFAELRRAGVIVDPLVLGPRSPRWTAEDFQEILRRLQRRPLGEEPEVLTAGKRRKQPAAGTPNRPNHDDHA